MITYQSTKFWQRSWFAALIGGLAIGGGAWWWQGHQEAEQAMEMASSASGATSTHIASKAAGKAAVLAAAQVASTPTVLPDGRPSDFTAEEWSALKAAISAQPNAKAELERVVSYLRFQRTFEQWQALADAPDVQRRHELANALLGQVPQRLNSGEVTMGEALLLGTALLTDLEPSEPKREQRLKELRDKLEGAAPPPDEAQAALDAARQKELKRRQGAILAECQAKAEGCKQPKLGQDMEAARRAVYTDAKP
jgi:hypothetical protein